MVQEQRAKITAAFKQEALRILSTSGRTVAEVAGDLGIGKSTLQRAIAIRSPEPSLIHHSDRGSQYCSDEYQKILKSHGMVISMSGRGNFYDNAMVETFFKTLKSELVWRTVFLSRWQAEQAIGTFIDGFYNPRRRYSALGYKSPILFEAAA